MSMENVRRHTIIKQKYAELIASGSNVPRQPLYYHFQEAFAKFSAKFLTWMHEIMQIPEDKMDTIIQEIEHMGRRSGYTDDYIALNNSDFFCTGSSCSSPNTILWW